MSKAAQSIKKVVLAYSGGLDTSIILKWLQETYNAEVVTFTADLGQGEELESAREKAVTLGIKPENISRSHFKSTTILMVVGIGLFVAGIALAILLSIQDVPEKGKRPHNGPRSKANACECNCDCGNDKGHRSRRR